MQERKCALVTGGSRGIGRGIARVLAREGYDIAITYATKDDEAQITKEGIEKDFGRRCEVFQASFDKPETPDIVMPEIIRALGRMDVLVCNAGVTRHSSLQELTDEMVDFLINLDFRSYVLCSRAAARHMIKHGLKGNIVYITSTHSVRAYPTDGMYGAMKSALNRSVESFALDMAPYGVRVNAVAPGATRVRPMNDWYADIAGRIPLGRVGEPEDVGELVAFLISEKASYITGVTVKIDGGLVLPGMPEKTGFPGWNGGKREKTWNDDNL